MKFQLFSFALILVSILIGQTVAAIYDNHLESAASEGQIKYAKEQNYDQTGPGAKEPEGAFKTYNKIEDALLGYLDDPDTKLPATERLKMEFALGRPSGFGLHEFTSFPGLSSDLFSLNNWGLLRQPFLSNGHRFREIQGVKGRPRYTYSYNVHDSKSGDRKRQQEFRNGDGSVHGLLTVIDPDGSEKTVQYISEDGTGFKTTVHRNNPLRLI